MADHAIRSELVEGVFDAATRYIGGKDRPAIEKVRDNFNKLSLTRAKEVYLIIFAYYKTLPLKGAQSVQTVFNQNIVASKQGPVDFSNSAPITKMTNNMKAFSEAADELMAGVEENFRNWAVLMRALEPALDKVVKEFATYGNVELKWLGQKGWFIFYFDRETSARWLKAQTEITALIMKKAATSYVDVKREPRPIPVKFTDWLALIKTIGGVTQPSKEVWHATVKDHFANPKPLSVSMSNEELACYLQAWLIVRPGRMLIDRDQVRFGGSIIDEDWLMAVGKQYARMFEPIMEEFDMPAVKPTVRGQKDLNSNMAPYFRVVRNFGAAYRQKFFGGGERRLKAGTARSFSKDIDFKSLFKTD